MKRRAMRAEHEKRLIPIDCTCTRVNEGSVPGHGGAIDRVFRARVPDGVGTRNKLSRAGIHGPFLFQNRPE